MFSNESDILKNMIKALENALGLSALLFLNEVCIVLTK